MRCTRSKIASTNDAGIKLGVPPPKNTVLNTRSEVSRAARSNSGEVSRPASNHRRYSAGDMAVEVAIGAFRLAERPVQVEPKSVDLPSFSGETGTDQLPKSVCSMGQRRLLIRCHFRQMSAPLPLAETSDQIQSPAFLGTGQTNWPARFARKNLIRSIRPSQTPGYSKTVLSRGVGASQMRPTGHALFVIATIKSRPSGVSAQSAV